MPGQYICRIASPEDMERKWDYEISRNVDDRENWIVWKKEAIANLREGRAIPYYGILDGEIICEATAIIHPDAAQNSTSATGYMPSMKAAMKNGTAIILAMVSLLGRFMSVYLLLLILDAAF